MIDRALWALTRWLERHRCGKETIGHEDCPLMLRWTFFERFGFKAMVHYFPPNVEDKDPHDHPRSFLTIVLWGAYQDVHWESYTPLMKERGELGPMPEWVRAPAVRFRSAEYMHIVETGHEGAWTIVMMGPMSRPWGFLRLDGDKKWWPWERYVEKFGGTVRCDTDDGDRSHELKRSGKGGSD